MISNLEEYLDASVYEAEYGNFTEDFELFLSLIDTGSVLDLACGTGRLTIPFAHKGLNVSGLDASKEMLSLAQKKGKNLNIEWIYGDMCNFHLNKKFDLIVMSGNSFQALLSEKDQERMLNCVKEHLKPSGIFVFNTRNPEPNDFETTHNFDYWHSFRDQKGEDVQVYGKQKSDRAHEIITYTTKRVWENKESITKIQLRFTPYELISKLLSKSGFEVFQVYGDFTQRPFQKDSPSIIPLCRLKNA